MYNNLDYVKIGKLCLINSGKGFFDMNEKDLKKLNRAELLELLILQTQENERLLSENETIKKQLEDRRIILEDAGSIAEASLRLNGIFEAAEEAAREYIESIKLCSERHEAATTEAEGTAQEKADRIISEAEKKAEDILTTAQNRADRILSDTEKRTKMQELAVAKSCEEMKRNAQKEAENYWNRISSRLDEYLAEHPEIPKNSLKL